MDGIYQLALTVDVLEAEEIGKHKDLSDFDQGLIVVVRWVHLQKLQVLIGVPGLQQLVLTKCGLRWSHWCTGGSEASGAAYPHISQGHSD